MASIEEEAAQLQLSLRLGMTTVLSVVKWADAQIAANDEPAPPLIDLSLMKEANSRDVLSKLGELAPSVSPLDVADQVLSEAHTSLLKDSAFGRSLARNLYEFWVESGYPDSLQECAAFDDQYALAEQGFISERDVLANLLEFTGGFANERS